MENNLEYPKNLIEKAKDQVWEAEEKLKKYPSSYSNIITLCQNAIELSAKAIFKIMGLDFPKEHQLLFDRSGRMRQEVKELLQKDFPKYFIYRDKIPRVIFLSYFWSNLYKLTKYGFEDLNIPPDKLFTKEDAELALKHAKESVNVAYNLLLQKNLEEKMR